jgi:hypothetical protein
VRGCHHNHHKYTLQVSRHEHIIIYYFFRTILLPASLPISF